MVTWAETALTYEPRSKFIRSLTTVPSLHSTLPHQHLANNPHCQSASAVSYNSCRSHPPYHPNYSAAQTINMLSLTVLFTSLLASFAVAQNSSSSFDPNSVDLTTRSRPSCSEISIGCISYADLDQQINGVKAREPIARTSAVDLPISRPTLALA